MTNILELKLCIKCGNKFTIDQFPYHTKSINTRRNECSCCYKLRKSKEYHIRKYKNISA